MYFTIFIRYAERVVYFNSYDFSRNCFYFFKLYTSVTIFRPWFQHLQKSDSDEIEI